MRYLVKYILTRQPNLYSNFFAIKELTNLFPSFCVQVLRCDYSQLTNGSHRHSSIDEERNESSNNQFNFTKLHALHSDSDYINSYRLDWEHSTTANALVKALNARFRLSMADLERILSDEMLHDKSKGGYLLKNLDKLCLAGVGKRSFIEYPWILSLDKKRLGQKLNLIQQISSIRDINHFVPFLRLTLPRLQKLIMHLNNEAHMVSHGNRVYYISEKLNIDANRVTKYLAKRLFILEMPFKVFKENLQHMLNYNVDPENVLKDLWAFRYTPQSVQIRLERAKRAKKEKIMPWMVRCPEPILQRSLKLTMDELKVLGDKNSVLEYVADRLGFNVSETNAIMAKHPQVYHVRVTKIKEVIDYLLNEAKFSRYDIAQVPRILCHGLETTKQRMAELESYGCRPSSLIILCRSKREYKKFVDAWLAKRNIRNSNESTAEEN